MLVTVMLLAAVAAAPVATPTPVPPAASAAARMGRSTTAAPRGKSLGEVARGIKLRLPEGESKVITNDTLREFSAGVELTTGTAPPPAPTGGADATASEEARKKAFWQERFFAAQQEADRLSAEEAALTQEVARLEREFYSRDDPYQRDNVIKPAWDDAMAKLRDVQQRLPAARRAPEELANAARRDGALPGWFREAPPPTPNQVPGLGTRE